jgi:hypothetical protein
MIMHRTYIASSGKVNRGEFIFIELEKFFRSKGHSADEATALAHEAMDELESWYEEKMEGEE